MKLVFLALLEIFLLVAGGGHSQFSKEVIESEIAKLQQHVTRGGDQLTLGRVWGRLGLLYQVKDVHFHSDQTDKPNALSAFNTALDYPLPDEERRDIYQHRGILLKMMGRGEEAIESHREALDLSSSTLDESTSWVHIADACTMMSRTDEAISALHTARSLERSNLNVYLPLVVNYKEANTLSKSQWATFLHDMEILLSQQPDNMAQTLQGSGFYWALYETALKSGQTEKAYKYLDDAHAIDMKYKYANYNPDANRVQVQQIRTVFQAGFWPPVSLRIGSATKVPIFIIGMMRSGSTLLETILDAHPDIFGMGEESIFNPMLSTIRDDIVKHYNNGNWDGVRPVIQGHAKTVVRKMVDLAKQEASSGNTTVKHVVDKMLFNYRNIGFIHLLFPKAVIIHMIRDPLDTLLSCYTHKFDDTGLEWTLNPTALVQEYINYLNIIDHFEKVLPGRILHVNYERLIKHPEVEIRRVIDRIGVRWHDDMLNFHSTNRTVHTHSMTQVRHQLFTSAIGKWVKHAEHLQPLITELKRQLRKYKNEGGKFILPDTVNWKLSTEFPYHGDSTATTNVEATPIAVDESLTEDDKVIKETHTAGGKSAPRGRRKKTPGTKKRRPKSPAKRKHRPKSAPVETATKPKLSGVVHVLGGGELLMDEEPGIHVKATPSVQQTPRPEVVKKTPSPSSTAPKRRRKVGSASRAAISSVYDAVVQKFGSDFSRRAQQIRLENPTGFAELDELVAFSVFLFNNRNYVGVVELLSDIAKYMDDSLDGLSVLGSALAMKGDLEESARVFTQLISVHPEVTADVYMRRAQVLSALNNFEAALSDINQSLKLEKSAGAYIQRGIIHFKLKAFYSARDDFGKALAFGESPELWNFIGQCEKEFGHVSKAVEAYDNTLRLDPDNLEAVLHKGISFIGNSDHEKALPLIAEVLQRDPKNKQALGYRALMYHNMGNAPQALQDYMMVSSLDATDATSRYFSGILNQAMGDYSRAVSYYQQTLAVDANHFSWTVMEIAYYRWSKLDSALAHYNADRDVAWQLKFSWVKNDAKSSHCKSKKPCALTPLTNNPPADVLAIPAVRDSQMNDEKRATIRFLLNSTSILSRWIQVNSPGFLAHRRQHKMFGLQVLQMAQTLRRHARSIASGGGGLTVQRDASSQMTNDDEIHILAWRDFFDIAVKWRQLAEPLDAVWWIDRTTDMRPDTDDADNEYLGLQTYIQTGVGENVRYYPYYKQAFNLTKHLLHRGYYYGQHIFRPTPPSVVPSILASRNLQELLDAVKNPFYIITPCYSSRLPDYPMQGTRIAIMPSTSQKQGFDFFISNPISSQRFDDFAEEISHIFESFVALLVDGIATGSVDEHGRLPPEQQEQAITYALQLFFYWTNFAPLTRGSASVGYSALVACLLAIGEVIPNQVPRGIQLDWESILRPNVEDFVATAKAKWISPREAAETYIPDCWLQAQEGCNMEEVFATSRDILYAINEYALDYRLHTNYR